MIVIYKNELYHHGIEGQKWGVRNGPPYPLDKNISDSITDAKRLGRSAKEHASRASNLYNQAKNTKNNPFSSKRSKLQKEASEENKQAYNNAADFFRELNDAELRLIRGSAGKTNMRSVFDDSEIRELYDNLSNTIYRDDVDAALNGYTSTGWINMMIANQIVGSYQRTFESLGDHEHTYQEILDAITVVKRSEDPDPEVARRGPYVTAEEAQISVSRRRHS